jgi:hypothetical protein
VTADAWEAKAEAAELMADERGHLYGELHDGTALDYETVELFGDWCHAWAAQFRAHTERSPDLAAYLAGLADEQHSPPLDRAGGVLSEETP